MTTGPAFTRVATLNDLPDGMPHGVAISGGERVCLIRVGQDVYAFEDRCSHAEYPLSEGEMVDDHVIECALHGAQFDVRDGSVVDLPATEWLRGYDIKVEEGMVWVRSRS